MGKKGSFDRADVLARVDLGDLADELVGPSKGVGDGRRWPSPTPGHDQTGKTPPMSIFRTRYGEERWTCFATGASGTAIDLVMTSRSMNFRDALEWLAGRAGVAEVEMTNLKPRPVRPKRRPEPKPLREPDPSLGEWVQACQRWLAAPAGASARGWLTERGIPEGVQVASGLGFDPGPSKLGRGEGLPRTYRAVVFPVRNEAGDVVYAQSRDLKADADPKYRNPSSALFDNPHLSFHETGSDLVVVAEGIPDALMVNTEGFSSVAVLGKGNTMGADFAERIGRFADGRLVVVALDADVATETVDAACWALEQTCELVGSLEITEGDLTDLWKHDPAMLHRELAKAADFAEMVL